MSLDDGSQINRSFFTLEDQYYGWGPTRYFSFFVQVGRGSESNTERLAESLLLGLATIAGLTGNIVVIACLLGCQELRRRSNYLIVNLGLSSLLFLSTGPCIVAARFLSSWKTSEASCQFAMYALSVSMVVSMWTHALISLERHRKILTPFRKQLTDKMVIAGCISIWLVNLAIFSPLFHFSHVYEVGDTIAGTPVYICTLKMPTLGGVPMSYVSLAYNLIFGFTVPLVIAITCYSRILRAVRTSHMKVKSYRKKSPTARKPLPTANKQLPVSSEPLPTASRPLPTMSKSLTACSTSGTRGKEPSSEKVNSHALQLTTLGQSLTNLFQRGKSTSLDKINNRRHVRTVSFLLALMGLFIITWLPVMLVLGMAQTAYNSESPRIASTAMVWAIFGAFFGSCLNPVIFCFVDGNFKRAMRKGFRKNPKLRSSVPSGS